MSSLPDKEKLVSRIFSFIRGGADDRQMTEDDGERTHVVEFALSATALLILGAALPLTAHHHGRAWLLVYAALVAAWWFMVRASAPRSLNHVLLIGTVAHLSVAFQQPLVFTLPARNWDGPVSDVLTTMLASSGQPLALRRALIVAIVLLGTSLLWQIGHTRRALGFATFPLIMVEGTLNARTEIIAAVLLFVGASFVRRNREGWAGFATFTSIGLFVPSIVLFPMIWDEAYHVAPFIGAALVVIFAAKFLQSGELTWSASVGNWITTSPSLSPAALWLAMQLTMWGLADFLNDLMTRAAKKLDTRWSWEFDDGLIAILLVFAAVIIVSSIVSRRARIPHASAADAIGTTLLLSAVMSPAAWMLVVPFAIASNRRIWVLVALCAPLLALAGNGSPWLVYGASLVAPAAWWLALRLTGVTGEGSNQPLPTN